MSITSKIICAVAIFVMACWGSGFLSAFTRFQGKTFGVMDALELEKNQKDAGFNPLKCLYWNGYSFYAENYAEKSVAFKMRAIME